MIDVPCSKFGESIEDYVVFQLIGKGGFGTVYKARCKNTGKDVAIKKIDKQTLKNDKYTQRVRDEVKIHSTLIHKSILKLYTFFEDDDFVYLVLELCPKGNLDQKLRQMGRSFKEEEAAEYLGQVVDGFIYLHSRGIMHRDLNPRNILFSIDEKIKIADFGLATKIKTDDEKHRTFCGTQNYISPEMANRQSYGLEADVYNIGCLLHTMFFGCPPGKTLKYKPRLSCSAVDFLNQCLAKEDKRIKLNHILRHRFFASYVDGRPSISHRSDSGMGSQSTNTASTQRQGVPLSAVCEVSEGFCSQNSASARNDRIRLPSHSPPVKLQANPHEKCEMGEAFGNFREKLYQNRNEIVRDFPIVCPPNKPYVNKNFEYKPEVPPGNCFDREEFYDNERNYPEILKEIQRSSGNCSEPVREVLNKFNYHHELLPSKVKPQRRNAHEQLQRVASNGGEIGPKEHGQIYPQQSNSLDRQRYEKERYKDKKAQIHSSGSQKHSTCSSCQMENDSNHRESRSNRHNTPSSPSAKSTKSTNSGRSRSRSVEVLKDIAPIHRSPSPPLASHRPPQHPIPPCPSPHALVPSPHHALPQHPPSPHPHHHHPHPHVPPSLPHHPASKRKQNSGTPSTSNPKKKTLRDTCPPLSIARLKSFRFHTKDVVFTIIEEKEVCAEFLDKHNKIIKCVNTLCQISEDGNEIKVYHPEAGTLLLTDNIIPIQREANYHVYNYDNLPSTYWKKYAYVARFVNTVKRNTVNISCKIGQDKCFLMENSPNADFKVVFTSGEKLLFSDNKLKVLGKDLTYDLGSEDFLRDKHFKSRYQRLYEHAAKMRDFCLRIEQSLTQLETLIGVPCVSIKRPWGSSPLSERQKLAHNGNNKENISPISIQSTTSRTTNIAQHLGPYESSINNTSTNSKTINMKNASYEQSVFCGTLYKGDKILRLKFFDGTSLECEHTMPSVLMFTDLYGKTSRYNRDDIPEVLEYKLKQFTAVVGDTKPPLSSANDYNLGRKPILNGRSQLPKCIR